MAANLGTLTLDLVAKIGGFTGPLDKASRESQKRMKEIKQSAEIAGKAIGALAVATAAGLAAMTVSTVRTANEISRLAQVSNSSTEEFQRYAAGAQAVGIEQDKLGDIFKDVNDKVGDFLQTGGGALADFFDNVAPKVGVTADQFRNLSGPQALGLYVSSLEKAGASQQDMTFYLEAIASDATALLPLLKNNAEGFRLLGDQAAQVGAILDNETIRAATELQAVSILTEQSLDGLRNQIAAGLLPVLSDLSGELFTVAGGSDIAREAGATFGNILKGVAAAAFGAYAAFQAVGKSIAALAVGFSAAGVNASDLLLGPLAPAVIGAKVATNFGSFKDALSVGFEDVGRSVEGYAEILDGIWNAGSGEGAEGDYAARIKLIADLLEQSRQSGKSAGIVIDENTKKTKQARDAIGEQIKALQLQARTIGMTADEEKLFRLEVEGATTAQLAQASAALKTIAAFEQNKKIQEDYKDLVADLRTEEEKRTDGLRDQLKVLDAMQGLPPAERGAVAGRIVDRATEDAPEFGGLPPEVGGAFGEFAKLDDAERKLGDWYSTQMAMLDKSRAERADLSATWDAEELSLKQQHEDKMGQIEKARQIAGISAMGDFFGQLATLRDSDSKKGRALGKTAAIAQATINAYTAATGAYASASAIPVVGWVLGPIAAGAALAAGLANVAAIKGMAHDGMDSIPQTGTWLLEKGERVTTAGTSAKLDATLDRVQSGMSSGGGSQRPINIVVNQNGLTDARQARQSEASTRRAIARGVAQSGRYT